jgi:hypothetical protein
MWFRGVEDCDFKIPTQGTVEDRRDKKPQTKNVMHGLFSFEKRKLTNGINA